MTRAEYVVDDPEVRDVMVRRLMEQRANNGTYPAGAIQRVADICGVDRSAVYRWCQHGSSRRQPRAAWTLNPAARAALLEANGDIALARELLLGRGISVRSRATFYRAVNHEPDSALVPYARVGAQGLLAKRVSLQAPRLGPNERWEIDHAVLPIEVLLKAGDSTPVKVQLTVVVDCDGGDIVGHVLSYPVPNRGHVLTVLRQAIERYGIPNLIACDNALTFTAAAVRQAAAMFDFRVAPLPAYTPEGKGSVERAVGTIKTRFCPLQPFYSKGARRKDRTLHGREEARLDVETLAGRLSDFVEDHNTKVLVPSLGGRTRAQVRAERSSTPRHATAEELRTLMLERIRRVVRKDGGIWIDNVPFFHPALHAIVGRTVRVGMMPYDYARIEVWVDDSWMCTATPTRTLSEEAREASRRAKVELNRDIGRLRRLANAQRERYAPITPDEPTPRPVGRWAAGGDAPRDARTSDPLGFGQQIGEVE